MVVDREGRAYVGNFGFDLNAGAEPSATVLIAVEPDGRPRVVAEDMWFPNGMVISGDGKTLIVAETFAGRLTAFDIHARRIACQPARVCAAGRSFFRRNLPGCGGRRVGGICLWILNPSRGGRRKNPAGNLA